MVTVKIQMSDPRLLQNSNSYHVTDGVLSPPSNLDLHVKPEYPSHRDLTSTLRSTNV